MMIEKLKEALAEAEKSANNFEIDQIAFLIGSFPVNHQLRSYVTGCPRIEKLLPEMNPCRSEMEALLRVGADMNREDIVGAVAERIRKAVRG